MKSPKLDFDALEAAGNIEPLDVAMRTALAEICDSYVRDFGRKYRPDYQGVKAELEKRLTDPLKPFTDDQNGLAARNEFLGAFWELYRRPPVYLPVYRPWTEITAEGLIEVTWEGAVECTDDSTEAEAKARIHAMKAKIDATKEEARKALKLALWTAEERHGKGGRPVKHRQLIRSLVAFYGLAGGKIAISERSYCVQFLEATFEHLGLEANRTDLRNAIQGQKRRPQKKKRVSIPSQRRRSA